jgi:hypothetical protein
LYDSICDEETYVGEAFFFFFFFFFGFIHCFGGLCAGRKPGQGRMREKSKCGFLLSLLSMATIYPLVLVSYDVL